MNEHFMPHGHCFMWTPEVLWPWVVGNMLTAACYAVIPFLIYLLWKRRPDLVPTWVALSFGSFILFCGLGHVVKTVTIWNPIYTQAAILDLVTGLVSIPAAVGLLQALRNVSGMLTAGQHEQAMSDLEDRLSAALEPIRAAAEHVRELPQSDEFQAARASYLERKMRAEHADHNPGILWACTLDGTVTHSRGLGLGLIGLEDDQTVGTNIHDWPQPWGWRYAHDQIVNKGIREPIVVRQTLQPFPSVTAYCGRLNGLGEVIAIVAMTVPTETAVLEVDLATAYAEDTRDA